MKEHFSGKKDESGPGEGNRSKVFARKSPAEERLRVSLGGENPAIIGPGDKVLQSPEGVFLTAVEKAREGPFIRYSKRLELMELADRLKIKRFAANLLIAQVQQRAGGIIPLIEENQRARSEETSYGWRDRAFLIAALFIFCALVDLMLVRFLF